MNREDTKKALATKEFKHWIEGGDLTYMPWEDEATHRESWDLDNFINSTVKIKIIEEPQEIYMTAPAGREGGIYFSEGEAIAASNFTGIAESDRNIKRFVQDMDY